MESTIPSDIESGPAQPEGSLETLAWRDVQRACYALSGAHGPARKVAKQDLIAALERLQRLSGGRQVE